MDKECIHDFYYLFFDWLKFTITYKFFKCGIWKSIHA